MARVCVFAVWDTKAQAYGNPFFMGTRGLALRSFEGEVNRSDPQNTLYMYPSDFRLDHLGWFDSDNGSFIPLDGDEAVLSPVLALGSDVKKAS